MNTLNCLSTSVTQQSKVISQKPRVLIILLCHRYNFVGRTLSARLFAEEFFGFESRSCSTIFLPFGNVTPGRKYILFMHIHGGAIEPVYKCYWYLDNAESQGNRS